jgi:hypothetical protein
MGWGSNAHPSDVNEDGFWEFANYGANFQVFGNPDSGDVSDMITNLTLATIADGTSQTIFFAEKFRRCGDNGALWAHGNWNVPWMTIFAYGNRTGTQNYSANCIDYPPQYVPSVGPNSKPQTHISMSNFTINCNALGAQVIHSSICNALMGDGSVRGIKSSVSGTTWWAAVTANSGDQLGNDW